MPGDENDDCGIRLFRLPEVREGAPVRDENCLELLGEAENGTTERFEERELVGLNRDDRGTETCIEGELGFFFKKIRENF